MKYYIIEQEYVGQNKIDEHDHQENILWGHFFYIQASPKELTFDNKIRNDYLKRCSGLFKTYEKAYKEAIKIAKEKSPYGHITEKEDDYISKIYPHHFDLIDNAGKWFEEDSFKELGLTPESDIEELAEKILKEENNNLINDGQNPVILTGLLETLKEEQDKMKGCSESYLRKKEIVDTVNNLKLHLTPKSSNEYFKHSANKHLEKMQKTIYKVMTELEKL